MALWYRGVQRRYGAQGRGAVDVFTIPVVSVLGDAAGEPAPVGDITPNDALLVIDMQGDFVPKSASNRDGGRYVFEY